MDTHNSVAANRSHTQESGQFQSCRKTCCHHICTLQIQTNWVSTPLRSSPLRESSKTSTTKVTFASDVMTSKLNSGMAHIRTNKDTKHRNLYGPTQLTLLFHLAEIPQPLSSTPVLQKTAARFAHCSASSVATFTVTVFDQCPSSELGEQPVFEKAQVDCWVLGVSNNHYQDDTSSPFKILRASLRDCISSSRRRILSSWLISVLMQVGFKCSK